MHGLCEQKVSAIAGGRAFSVAGVPMIYEGPRVTRPSGRSWRWCATGSPTGSAWTRSGTSRCSAPCGQKKAVSIAVRGGKDQRRWSKLRGMGRRPGSASGHRSMDPISGHTPAQKRRNTEGHEYRNLAGRFSFLRPCACADLRQNRTFRQLGLTDPCARGEYVRLL
jgi:hypothetical protein